MNRILLIELRRSAAAGTALVLGLIGAGLLYTMWGPWPSGWMPLAMQQRQYLVLLWPLALAAGAWQSRREQRSNVGELFASTARPVRQRVAPILAVMAVAASTGYLAMAAVAVPWIADTATYVPTAAIAVLSVGALSMIVAAWLGLAVGRLVPSPVTAPLLAVAGLGALLLLTPTVVGSRQWLAALLSPMQGMGLFSDFRTVSGRVSAAQGIWLAGLAITAVVLIAAGSRRMRAAAVLPLLLGAAVGTAVIPRGGGVDYSPEDPVARELVCAEGTPRVCVSRTRAGLLTEVTPLARQGLAALAKLPDAPTAAVEDTNTFLDKDAMAYQAGTVAFQVDVGNDGHLMSEREFLFGMVSAAGANHGACPDGLDIAGSRAVAYWLMGREPMDDPREPEEVNAQIRMLWQGLRALPQREATARVVAVRTAALACQDLDGLLAASTS